jgi:phosphatidylserine/phosphatidylglycerophosphate/cardiolipin synthase-like enzyme
MVRAFSLTSEGLGYFLGYTLVRAPRVAIISPWLSDVDVRLPLTNRDGPRRLKLSEALEELVDTSVRLVVRSGEDHNSYIRNRLPDHVELTELDDLHAKAIVAPEFVYLGSANITRGGLETNRELCEIIENEYESVEQYVKNVLDYDL